MGLTITLRIKAIAVCLAGVRRANVKTDCGCDNWSDVAYVQHRYLSCLFGFRCPTPVSLTVAE